MRNTITYDAGRVALGIATVIGAILLVRLGGFDARAAAGALRGLGPSAWLALLPFALLLVVEAMAWAIALDLRPRALLLVRLMAARLGIESVSLTVPGSIFVSDGIAPLVFSRSADVELPTAIAGVAIKKWGIILGHMIVLAIAALVGGGFLDRVDADPGQLVAPRLALSTAAVLSALCATWLASLMTSGTAERVTRFFARIPSASARTFAARVVESAARTDAYATRLFTGPRTRVIALVAVSTFVWIAESFEVYVLFVVLGVSPSFPEVLAMEALLTIVRSVAFFSPGGLGAQELAYLGLIPPLLGVHGVEIASAFVVLRRVRDVATIALGYTWLASRLVRGREVRPAPTS